MSQLLEPAVGRVDSPANDRESLPLHLLAKEIVLGKENLLVKSAEVAEFSCVEQHEHSGGEGMMEAGEILEHIIAQVEQLVDQIAVAAENVRGHAMKLLALGQFHGTANEGRMCQFNVGVE